MEKESEREREIHPCQPASLLCVRMKHTHQINQAKAKHHTSRASKQEQEQSQPEAKAAAAGRDAIVFHGKMAADQKLLLTTQPEKPNHYK